MSIAKNRTVADALTNTLRRAANAFSPGDQVAPCAVLWLDPDRLWEPAVLELSNSMPELFVLGPYSPAKRTGPALWLRCIEARAVPETPPSGTVPILYLPGICREDLKDLEHVASDWAPLAEMQFRGSVWLHPNGKEWTPFAFLISGSGGLGLSVGRDQATREALLRALPKLLQEPVDELREKALNADFFDELMAPDAPGLILRWLNDPDGFINRTSAQEWKAFCQQCKSDYKFDPEKDGALRAAELLAQRGNHWSIVWKRFAEAPRNYKGVTKSLRRAGPKKPSMYDTAEVWPSINEQQESELATVLRELGTKPHDIVARRVRELEKQHGARRQFPWVALGFSPLAVMLEPLAKVAELCEHTPGGPTAEAFASAYIDHAWEVDAAALEVMAACETNERHKAILDVLRAMYFPWLDNTARHLQHLLQATGKVPEPRHTTNRSEGQVVLFADGLRFDVAALLKNRLTADGWSVVLDWDWAPLPTVTATAKPLCSPLATLLRSGEIDNEFAPNLENGQRVTQDRFVQALQTSGWQVLNGADVGDPAGSAWTEAGTLDKRGHNEGWKIARIVADEVRDLTNRIGMLLNAGWSRVHVVTDHGWLLLPDGLPKVELKAFLAEHRWGRCAAIKAGVTTTLPEFTWHWNDSVRIVVPPGIACFKAGVEYSHGGVSLQEMVVPRLTVGSQVAGSAEARLGDVRWTGARCRITVKGALSGLNVDVRARIGDAATSFLVGKQAKAVSNDRTVVLFLEDDGDIGKKAIIVLVNSSGQVIDSLTTELGVNE